MQLYLDIVYSVVRDEFDMISKIFTLFGYV